MRLVDPDRGIHITFAENMANVLVVESKAEFADIISELLEQECGHEGAFILSDDNQSLPIAKAADLLLTPFTLDFQNKKIVNRLHQELGMIANEEMSGDIGEINAMIVSLMDRLTYHYPYAITYNLDVDIFALLKLYAVSIDDASDGLLERLCNYMKIMSRLCGIRLFIFVNLSSFLGENDFSALYEMMAYEKMTILLLENSVRKWHECEIVDIIDKDHCLIHL